MARDYLTGTSSDYLQIGLDGPFGHKRNTKTLDIKENDNATIGILNALVPGYSSLSLLNLPEYEPAPFTEIDTSNTVYTVASRSFLNKNGVSEATGAFLYVRGRVKGEVTGQARLQLRKFGFLDTYNLETVNISSTSHIWHELDVLTAFNAIPKNKYQIELQIKKTGGAGFVAVQNALLVFYREVLP